MLCESLNGLCQTCNLLLHGCSVLCYGGQVLSWKNQRGEELLFVSEKKLKCCLINCHDQFYDYGCLEGNGFARTRMWNAENLMDVTDFPYPTPDNAYVDLILDDMPDGFPNWTKHRFELRLRVILGPTGDLTMTTRVKNINTNGKPFSFKFSYHTYFSVSNIRATQIEGLETMKYRDYLQDGGRFTEGANPISFQNEVDRAYLNTRDDISVADLDRLRTFTIHKNASLTDIGVWNPWEDGAMHAADLGDEEYRQMVLVGAAAVRKEVTLMPFREWTGTQRLSVVELD
ncbi:hypothetical protein MIMGU_mgv1a026840mg [Erythranthe guttata]|uniref:glucose-6-phosphate 1-epimerase n=1 Tax=Erythranthe guttata TaxID=4155 RepID=A0A022PX09_ERYGU|nr:hypothetical protein MIMGU_mgv1a026840mg [Erythranthe guttata]